MFPCHFQNFGVLINISASSWKFLKGLRFILQLCSFRSITRMFLINGISNYPSRPGSFPLSSTINPGVCILSFRTIFSALAEPCKLQLNEVSKSYSYLYRPYSKAKTILKLSMPLELYSFRFCSSLTRFTSFNASVVKIK